MIRWLPLACALDSALESAWSQCISGDGIGIPVNAAVCEFVR